MYKYEYGNMQTVSDLKKKIPQCKQCPMCREESNKKTKLLLTPLPHGCFQRSNLAIFEAHLLEFWHNNEG